MLMIQSLGRLLQSWGKLSLLLPMLKMVAHLGAAVDAAAVLAEVAAEVEAVVVAVADVAVGTVAMAVMVAVAAMAEVALAAGQSSQHHQGQISLAMSMQSGFASIPRCISAMLLASSTFAPTTLTSRTSSCRTMKALYVSNILLLGTSFSRAAKYLRLTA